MKERKQNNYGQDDLDMELANLPDEEELRRQRRQQQKAREERKLRQEQREEESAKKQKTKKTKRMTNKEITRVTYMFVTLFLVMIGYLVYFNVVKSKDVINSVYNIRQDILAERVIRGKILDSEGNILAQTVTADDGTETREYPYGDMFTHTVGYAVKGKSGVESIQNFNLLTSNAPFLEKLMKEFQNQKNVGDNVVTTLNSDLQAAAYNALGNNKGAVVVLEPSTGKILAMVSKPSFDANTVSENWDNLINDKNSVLVNRATQGQYTPGSVFKLVTTLSFMRQNADYEAYLNDCSGETTVDGTTIHCYANQAHGQETLADAVANSCNTAFSGIGLQLDISKWQDTAKDLLFNTKLKCDLVSNQSSFSLDKSADSASVMMTAIGQGDTLVSPYHMAMITAAIANGGKLMKPYLVDEITNYQGTRVKKYMPEKYTDLMTSEEAAVLTEYMKRVISYGTGTSLSGESYTVAGKTGTAEVSMDKTQVHSWFVGFSNVDNPDLAVAVVVENADTSSITGISVAKQIFNAYYYR